jgi:hypothetical protein
MAGQRPRKIVSKKNDKKKKKYSVLIFSLLLAKGYPGKTVARILSYGGVAYEEEGCLSVVG